MAMLKWTCPLFLFQNLHYIYPWASRKDTKLQGKPPAHKREHSALQKYTFLYYLYFFVDHYFPPQCGFDSSWPESLRVRLHKIVDNLCPREEDCYWYPMCGKRLVLISRVPVFIMLCSRCVRDWINISAVLRIRDVYPGSRIWIFPSRITDSGSRVTKNSGRPRFCIREFKYF